MKKVVALLGSMALSSLAYAEGSIITGINLSGSGCSAQDTNYLISDDAKTISIFFDKYVAQTTEASRIGRASCNLGVALKLPEGFTVQVDTVDFRGAAYPSKALDEDGNEIVTGTTSLSREYFFAGMRVGAKKVSRFEEDTDFTERDTLMTSAFAPCGGDVILRVNTSLEAKRGLKDKTEQSSIGVDTIDVQRKFEQTISFSFIPCHR